MICGGPYRVIASRSASVRLNRNRDSVRENAAARPAEHGDEDNKAAGHRDAGDVHRPDVVHTLDGQAASDPGACQRRLKSDSLEMRTVSCTDYAATPRCC